MDLFRLPVSVLSSASKNGICCFLRASEAQHLARTCKQMLKELNATVQNLRRYENPRIWNLMRVAVLATYYMRLKKHFYKEIILYHPKDKHIQWITAEKDGFLPKGMVLWERALQPFRRNLFESIKRSPYGSESIQTQLYSSWQRKRGYNTYGIISSTVKQDRVKRWLISLISCGYRVYPGNFSALHSDKIFSKVGSPTWPRWPEGPEIWSPTFKKKGANVYTSIYTCA